MCEELTHWFGDLSLRPLRSRGHLNGSPLCPDRLADVEGGSPWNTYGTSQVETVFGLRIYSDSICLRNPLLRCRPLWSPETTLFYRFQVPDSFRPHRLLTLGHVKDFLKGKTYEFEPGDRGVGLVVTVM